MCDMLHVQFYSFDTAPRQPTNATAPQLRTKTPLCKISKEKTLTACLIHVVKTSEDYKTLKCSIQLIMKFILLINDTMQTIFKTCMSRINATSIKLKQKKHKKNKPFSILPLMSN